MTSGTFSLDGQTFDVENNVWVAGDDTECVVLDAPHDAAAILDVIDGRRVLAIVATHAHDDHAAGRARTGRGDRRPGSPAGRGPPAVRSVTSARSSPRSGSGC